MSLAFSNFLDLTAIYIMLALAIYIVFRVGQLSVAPVFTMIVGSYITAYLARDLSWPFGFCVLAALCLGTIPAFLLGIALARAPAFATAIATISLIFIAQAVFRNIDALGGPRGFFNIPKVNHLSLFLYVFAAILTYTIYRLDNSRFGRDMEVIFTDVNLASSLGINAYAYRLVLQVLSGAIGAFAGALYAFYVGYIHPYDIGFSTVLFLVCFIFVGGHTTIWGLIIFTPTLWALSVFLPTGVAVWKDVIYGVLLIVILIFRPEGVIDKKLLRYLTAKTRVLFNWF